MRQRNLGEVVGGGTTMAPEPAGIENCDIEIALNEHSDAAVADVTRMLEQLGAPKGSKMHVPGKSSPLAFGTWEGLAIFLNGTDLPDETYARSDVNRTISHLSDAMGDTGMFRGHWEGSSETALYFYGPRFADMRAAVTPYLPTDPLCALARIEQIA